MPIRKTVLFVLSFSAVSAAAGDIKSCLHEFARAMTLEAPLEAHFSMTKRLTGLDAELPARGSVFIAPGEGLIWQTDFPLQQTRVFGHTKSASTDDKGVFSVKENRFAGNVAQLATMTEKEIINNLSTGFFLDCTKTAFGVRLIASPRTGNLTNLITEIAAQTQGERLQRVLITQTEGTVTRIHFEDIRTPAQISEERKKLLELVRAPEKP